MMMIWMMVMLRIVMIMVMVMIVIGMVLITAQDFSVFKAFLYFYLSLLALLAILCRVALCKPKFNSTEIQPYRKPSRGTPCHLK